MRRSDDSTVRLPASRRCHRCGYGWVPRVAVIRMCPKCKSKLWNVPVGEKRQGRRTDIERKREGRLRELFGSEPAPKRAPIGRPKRTT